MSHSRSCCADNDSHRCESLGPSEDGFAAIASAPTPTLQYRFLIPSTVFTPYPGIFLANPGRGGCAELVIGVKRLQQLPPRARGSCGYPHELLQQAEGKPSKVPENPRPLIVFCASLSTVWCWSGTNYSHIPIREPLRSHLPFAVGIVLA